MAGPLTCKVPGCAHPVHVKKHGLCRGHTKRYYETGTVGGPLAPRQMRPPAKLGRAKKAKGAA